MTSLPNSEPLSLPNLETETHECDKHGSFEARVLNLGMPDVPKVYSRCPDCSRLALEKKERDDADERAANRRWKVRSLLNKSGIPPRFEDRRFSTYRAETTGQRVALVSCKAYAENWPAKLDAGGGLVLTGGPGTGKTHLACSIATHAITEHLADVWFGTVTQLLRHVKETYRKDSERSEQEAIDDLVKPDLLIVDEIGVQTGSDHEKMLVFEILNERYQNLRPTIIISNLSATDLEGYIGQRVMDRFRECGDVLAFDWQSHRGKKP